MRSGNLVVYCGCMFSGKSGRLIESINKAEFCDKNYFVYKPGIDDRHGERFIGSHSGLRCDADILEHGEEDYILDNLVDEVDFVFIDDANLLSSLLVEVVMDLLDMGIDVHIAATDKDFRGEPFEPVNDLVAIADDVVKLKAVCEVCGSEATMSQRIIDGEPSCRNEDIILIDSKESYEARCRDCHVVMED